MGQHNNFDSAMEARYHFTCASRSASKNGASSKSHKSRENFRRITQMFSTLKKMAMIAIFAMFIAGNTNAQTVPKQFAKTASRTVKMASKSASRTAKMAGKSTSRTVKMAGNSASRTVRIAGKSASRTVKMAGNSASRTVRIAGNSISRTVWTTDEMEACCDRMEYSPTIQRKDNHLE